MSQCIICLQDHDRETIEHIVPRSLGNIHYILPKGKVCVNCNNRFAQFEYQVVNSSTFLSIRKELGIRISTQQEPTILNSRHLILFLIKMAFEALYKSKRQLLTQHLHDGLRLILVSNNPPTQIKIIQNHTPQKRLPGWIDQWRLRGTGIGLYLDDLEDQLLFTFTYFDTILSMDIKKAARWRLYNL